MRNKPVVLDYAKAIPEEITKQDASRNQANKYGLYDFR